MNEKEKTEKKVVNDKGWTSKRRKATRNRWDIQHMFEKWCTQLNRTTAQSYLILVKRTQQHRQCWNEKYVFMDFTISLLILMRFVWSRFLNFVHLILNSSLSLTLSFTIFLLFHVNCVWLEVGTERKEQMCINKLHFCILKWSSFNSISGLMNQSGLRQLIITMMPKHFLKH